MRICIPANFFGGQMRESFVSSWPLFPKMSQPLPKISANFPKASECCRKMSEDVPTTFEHFRFQRILDILKLLWKF